MPAVYGKLAFRVVREIYDNLVFSAAREMYGNLAFSMGCDIIQLLHKYHRAWQEGDYVCIYG